MSSVAVTLQQQYYNIQQLSRLVAHHVTTADIHLFKQCWEQMPIDQYLPAGQACRRRCLAKFLVNTDGQQHFINEGHFFQSSAVNNVLGDIDRYYQIANESFIRSPLVTWLIDHYLQILQAVEGQTNTWVVTLHLIRVTATDDADVSATPEGIHRDGHDYISQHLIDRVGISGGRSQLYNNAGQLQATYCLRQFMESILLKDSEMLHSVSAIKKTNTTSALAYRDMLIIDYDKVEATHHERTD